MNADLEFLSDQEKAAFATPSNRVISPGFQRNQEKIALPGYTFIHSRVRQCISLISINQFQPFFKHQHYAVPE